MPLSVEEFSEFDAVREAFAAMDEFEAAASLEPIRGHLERLLEPWGITHFLFTRLPQPCLRITPHLMLRAWPEEWLTRYDRLGYYRDDPAAARCGATVEPFDWTGLHYETESRAAWIMGEAAEHGLAQGLCVPIHDLEGFQAVVSLAGAAVEMPPRMRRAAHLLALCAYGATERIIGRRRPAPKRLSTRERDTLLWLADGRSMDEIADVFTVSKRTVETYLGRAGAKLGTRTTTHTVVEAIRQHEI